MIEFFEDGGRRELYDLSSDPGEQRDLSATMPDKAASMYRALQNWQQDTGAALPVRANPSFDPQAMRPRGGPGAGDRTKSKRGPAKPSSPPVATSEGDYERHPHIKPPASQSSPR